MLSRTKITGLVGFDATTPSRKDLRQKLAGTLKLEENKVAITLIKTAFGERKAKFEANVYDSIEDLSRFESVIVLRRLGMAPKKVKAAKEQKKSK